MKSVSLFRLLPSIPCAAVIAGSLLMSFGCGTIPEKIPAPTQTKWVFDADFDTRALARVAIGDTRSTVISSLGTPVSAENFTTDRNVEVLSFVRIAIGPKRMRSVKTANGMLSIIDNARFKDEITVYLKSGVVASVTVHRSLEQPPGPSERYRNN